MHRKIPYKEPWYRSSGGLHVFVELDHELPSKPFVEEFGLIFR
jgi:hypothetical protein